MSVESEGDLEELMKKKGEEMRRYRQKKKKMAKGRTLDPKQEGGKRAAKKIQNMSKKRKPCCN